MPETLPRICAIAGALDVIGDRWSLLVVRELSLGVHRFNEIAASTGAPRDILTARLRKLVDLGVVETQPYSERPPRHEYVLTSAGRDLTPVLQALRQWGDDHTDVRSPIHFTHDCGADFRPEMHCAACGERVSRGSLHRDLR
jgi:DNA-binding HxlR family transcriptional regulator